MEGRSGSFVKLNYTCMDFENIEMDDHFIPDGMNAFERNTKRIGDFLIALVALIVFHPCS